MDESYTAAVYVPKKKTWETDGGFHGHGVPPNGWFVREHPIKIDDLGVPPFVKTPTWKKTLQDPRSEGSGPPGGTST